MDNIPLRSSLKNNMIVAFTLFIVVWGVFLTISFEQVLRVALNQTGLDKSIIQEITRRSILLTTGFTLCGIVVAICIAIIVAKNIIQPITKLNQAVDRITQGHLGVKLEISSINEVGKLASAFNIMSENLQHTTVSKVYVDNILNNMTDALCVTDPNKVIETVNQAACTLFGYREDELLGKSFETLWTTEQGRAILNSNFSQIISKEKRTIQYQIEYVSRSEKTIPMLLSLAGMYDTEGNLERVIVISKNMTEQKKIQEELFKAEKLEALSLFAGGVAHDFQNVLTCVFGYLEMAKKKLPADGQISEFLSISEQGLERAEELSRNLMHFAKEGVPVKLVMPLHSVLRESVIFSLRDYDVACSFSIPDDLWLVDIDKGQINQVLTNLTINAVQAMSNKGSIEIECENVVVANSEITSLDAGNYVAVSFKDTGPGIHPENHDKIFDPYFTTKKEGNGLGLATCYSIMQKHGGTMIFRAPEGYGAEFILYLPAIVSIPKNTKILDSVSIKKLNTGSGTNRILVMDDDAMTRELLNESLSQLGYIPITAGDGTEAIALYREAIKQKTPFDVVLMDLTIKKGMGGKEAIRELQGIDQNVKIIVSSGYSDDTLIQDCSAHGFCGVLNKPYKIEELRNILKNVLS